MTYPGYDNAYAGGANPSTSVAGPAATVQVTAPQGAVSGKLTGEPAVLLTAAPQGTAGVTVTGGLASQIFDMQARQGAVSAASSAPISTAVAGEAAATTVRAPVGGVAAASASAAQMPSGEVASLVVRAPVGSVAAQNGAAPTTGPVFGVAAAVTAMAPVGTIVTTPVVEGPVAGLVITAPVGDVAAFTIDRAGDVLTLELVDTQVPVQPGVLGVQITNGVPDTIVYLFIDGVSAAQSTLDEDGAVSLSVAVNNLSVAAHSIAVSATSSPAVTTADNTKTFDVLTEPAPAPDVFVYTPPAPVVNVNRWTFQQRLPGGVSEIYVLPLNPEKSSPVYGEFAFSSAPTTASNGRLIEWEGSFVPTVWRFAGRVLTREQHDAMLDWCSRGRFYITDHLGRRYYVKVSSLSTTRVRDRLRPWHHSYEVSAYVMSGDGVLV